MRATTTMRRFAGPDLVGPDLVGTGHAGTGQRNTLLTNTVLASTCLAAGVFAAGCTNTPTYLEPREALEVGIPDTEITEATTTLVLPVRPETMAEEEQRARLEESLGVDVPIVTVDDISVSIEWTIKNLSDSDGVARVHLNGGNESFLYVPENFVIDPEEDEEPPPLVGNIPIPVPALGTVSGVIREDQIREAAVDMELITRGGYNPFAALLQFNRETVEVQAADGSIVPEIAFGQLVQYDLRFLANRHMVFEYQLRARDHEDVLHELLLDAPEGETIDFAPVEFQPPPPVEE